MFLAYHITSRDKERMYYITISETITKYYLYLVSNTQIGTPGQEARGSKKFANISCKCMTWKYLIVLFLNMAT